MKTPFLAAVVLASGCLVSTRPAPSGPPPSGPPPQEPREHRDHDHDHGPPPPGPRPERHIYLEGRVTDPSGTPIGRAAIDYTGPVVGTVQTDADGYFKTPEVPPGEYNVRVRREHFETMIKPAHVIDGPQRVDIVMKAK